MPRADFRLKGEALDPLAPVKVIAVMCHPADARGREVMMRRIPEQITIPRGQSLKDALGGAWRQELWSEFLDHRRPGCLAGAVALALAQLRASHHKGETATVLALASGIAARWEAAVEPEAPPRGNVLPHAPDHAEVTRAFQTYGSVVHLWAALVYGKLQNREDLEPFSTQTLPTFLAFAEEIGRLATTLEWRVMGAGLELAPDALWTFVLPARLRKTAKAQMLAPAPSQADVHEPFERRQGPINRT